MISRFAIAGLVLSAGAVGFWVIKAHPEGQRLRDSLSHYETALADLDARTLKIAGNDLVMRATEASKERTAACLEFERNRVTAAMSIIGDPETGRLDAAPLDEVRRLAAVARQEASRVASEALKANGGPDVAGWPLLMPSWMEPSAPDPDAKVLATELATVRLDAHLAEICGKSGVLATAPMAVTWTRDEAAAFRRASVTLHLAGATASVPALMQRLVASLSAKGALVSVEGLALTPPEKVRAGFGSDPAVDVVVRLSAAFPVPREVNR